MCIRDSVNVERVFGQVRRDLDVFLDGEVGHQVVELEDKAQLTAAILAQVGRFEHREVAAVHNDGAAVGILQAAEAISEFDDDELMTEMLEGLSDTCLLYTSRCV